MSDWCERHIQYGVFINSHKYLSSLLLLIHIYFLLLVEWKYNGICTRYLRLDCVDCCDKPR